MLYIENAITMMLQTRRKAFISLCKLYKQLDIVIKDLYQPELYTVVEFEELARQYYILQWNADRVEKMIRENYPAVNLEETIKWLKYGIAEPETAEGDDTTSYNKWFMRLTEENYLDAVYNNPDFF